MKLTKQQRELLSEALISLSLKEAKEGRPYKAIELVNLDRILFKFFISQLTEGDFK